MFARALARKAMIRFARAVCVLAAVVRNGSDSRNWKGNTMEQKRSLGMGPTIKALRRQSGLTQAQLAERCGLERTSITNIEKGHQQLTEHTMVRIAEALGCELRVRLHRKLAFAR